MTDIEVAIRFFNGWKNRDEKDREIIPQNTVAYNAYTKEIEYFELAIKALKQEKESVLDKIFPDNATNGDMIKTIFPNLEWRDERGDTKSYILEPEHILSPKLIAFNRWWDAPYKALEQESVLDKIRTEIEQVVNQEKLHDEKWALGLNYALHIIDKYKAESEEEK